MLRIAPKAASAYASPDSLIACYDERYFSTSADLVRSFEVLDLETLAVANRAEQPAALSLFYRWQDPAWKRQTVSSR